MSADLLTEKTTLQLDIEMDQRGVSMDTLNFGPEDIAKTFDVPLHALPPVCLEYLARCDMRFRYLRGHEREHTIMKVLRVLNQPLEVSGPARKAQWESGWSENLEGFIQSGFDLTELLPKYYKPGEIMRWNGDYLLPFESNFEVQFFTVLRLWLFNEYFRTVSHVYEFGCGTGHNLVVLRKLFPEKHLIGFLKQMLLSFTMALRTGFAPLLKIKMVIFGSIQCIATISMETIQTNKNFIAEKKALAVWTERTMAI